MTVRQKGRGKAQSMPVGILAGSLLGVITLAGTSLLLSWLIHTGRIPYLVLGYASMAILGISGAIGALIAIRLIKRRKMLVSILCATALVGVLLVVNALFFGGNYQGGVTTVVTIYAWSALPAFLITRHEKKGKHHIP